MGTIRNLIILSLTLLGIAAFQNCAPVKATFSPAETVAETVPAAGLGDSTNDSSNPVEIPIPATGAEVLPQLSMKVNPCQANTLCVVDFYLSKALADKFSFDWRTNDTKYQQDPAKYAQPNVHYVPAVGVLEFNPGETHRQVKIQALTGFSQILIPLIIDRCMLNSKLMDCQALAGK